MTLIYDIDKCNLYHTKHKMFTVCYLFRKLTPTRSRKSNQDHLYIMQARKSPCHALIRINASYFGENLEKASKLILMFYLKTHTAALPRGALDKCTTNVLDLFISAWKTGIDSSQCYSHFTLLKTVLHSFCPKTLRLL